MTRQISVIVADDHPIVLCGVVDLLRTHPDMNVLAACSRGADALKAIREMNPEIAVLDVSMPDLDGPAVLLSLGQRTRTTEPDGHKTRYSFAVADDHLGQF